MLIDLEVEREFLRDIYRERMAAPEGTSQEQRFGERYLIYADMLEDGSHGDFVDPRGEYMRLAAGYEILLYSNVPAEVNQRKQIEKRMEELEPEVTRIWNEKLPRLFPGEVLGIGMKQARDKTFGDYYEGLPVAHISFKHTLEQGYKLPLMGVRLSCDEVISKTMDFTDPDNLYFTGNFEKVGKQLDGKIRKFVRGDYFPTTLCLNPLSDHVFRMINVPVAILSQINGITELDLSEEREDRFINQQRMRTDDFYTVAQLPNMASIEKLRMRFCNLSTQIGAFTLNLVTCAIDFPEDQELPLSKTLNILKWGRRFKTYSNKYFLGEKVFSKVQVLIIDNIAPAFREEMLQGNLLLIVNNKPELVTLHLKRFNGNRDTIRVEGTGSAEVFSGQNESLVNNGAFINEIDYLLFRNHSCRNLGEFDISGNWFDRSDAINMLADSRWKDIHLAVSFTKPEDDERNKMEKPAGVTFKSAAEVREAFSIPETWAEWAGRKTGWRRS